MGIRRLCHVTHSRRPLPLAAPRYPNNWPHSGLRRSADPAAGPDGQTGGATRWGIV